MKINLDDHKRFARGFFLAVKSSYKSIKKIFLLFVFLKRNRNQNHGRENNLDTKKFGSWKKKNSYFEIFVFGWRRQLAESFLVSLNILVGLNQMRMKKYGFLWKAAWIWTCHSRFWNEEWRPMGRERYSLFIVPTPEFFCQWLIQQLRNTATPAPIATRTDSRSCSRSSSANISIAGYFGEPSLPPAPSEFPNRRSWLLRLSPFYLWSQKTAAVCRWPYPFHDAIVPPAPPPKKKMMILSGCNNSMIAFFFVFRFFVN